MPNKDCPWVFFFKLMWEQFGKKKALFDILKIVFKEFLNEVPIYLSFVKKYARHNYIIFRNILKAIHYDACYWCKRHPI